MISDYVHLNYSGIDKQKSLMTELLTGRSLELIALKVDKLSGDLRQAFNILRQTISNKLETIEASDALAITYEDTNRTII